MESTLKELSPNFIAYWNETVKPVAELCAPKELWDYAYKVERDGYIPKDTDPELIRLKELKDANGLWYVGWLVRDIGNAMVLGVRFDLMRSLMQISSCLSHNNASYWTNVFGDDYTSPEAVNMRKLGELMPLLCGIMNISGWGVYRRPLRKCW